MTTLEIAIDDFPDALDSEVKLGDHVTLTISGWVHKTEAQLVDATTLGNPTEYLAGRRTVTILVTDAHR